jgi:hypothetical protein
MEDRRWEIGKEKQGAGSGEYCEKNFIPNRIAWKIFSFL